jgi:hypothetical protein
MKFIEEQHKNTILRQDKEKVLYLIKNFIEESRSDLHRLETQITSEQCN